MKVPCVAGLAFQLSIWPLWVLWLVTNPGKTRESWGACRRSGSIRIQRPDFLTLHHHCPLPFSAISPSVVGSLAGLGRPRSRSALLLLSPQRGPETNPDNESTTLIGGQNCISRPKLHWSRQAGQSLKKTVSLSPASAASPTSIWKPQTVWDRALHLLLSLAPRAQCPRLVVRLSPTNHRSIEP